MTVLTPYILLLMLAATLFVLVPVLRFRHQKMSQQSDAREQKNIELFQQNISELENNLADNLITQDEHEKLKLEFERNFLNDMESGKASKKKSASSYTKLAPLVLMFFIPIGSFLFYRSIGSGPELVLPELIERLNSSDSVDEQLVSLTEIAEVLNQRFQRRSDDVQTGYTLGTLYISLEEYADAIRVFSQLSEGMEPNIDKATVLGQLAQSQYLLADSTITPTAQKTIDEALLLNSNEQAIMSILAVEALLGDDLAGAASYWRRQISQLPVGSAQIAQLNERIATIESFLGEDQLDAAQNGYTVTVRVSIDESIRDQIDPEMRVFVFARSESVQFPLAAREYALADLPLDVILDDSMAMMPQFTLSTVETVFVGATIARTATADTGGFRVQSESFILAEQEGPIDLLVIDPVP
ncbi:MAG: c-type cytochrome biogenesis protein CcmI [SAR86 cluster bacterium]|uniref:C-type cytochrome biogenesis protein CcmI n=1 Tax=SAR86 cluster bacterium TaxID=2030880 RepID=A0A2A5CC25_9GAMM|nr:MAG: c-type cytochrome biogenesis protein CcmI [SAR86 cluster bacterium]